MTEMMDIERRNITTPLKMFGMMTPDLPSGYVKIANWKMAIETSLIYPLKMGIFHSCVNVYRRVSIFEPFWSPDFQHRGVYVGDMWLI